VYLAEFGGPDAHSTRLQVRVTSKSRAPDQKSHSKLGRSYPRKGEFIDELENVSQRAGSTEIWLVEAVMSGAGYRASSQSRQR
jgi:hypothetical protein